MGTLTQTLSNWRTEDLIGEVVRRSAGDAGALRSIEDVIIRARLAQNDGRSEQYALAAGPETNASLKSQRADVCGTIEMALADVALVAEPLTSPGHEVDASMEGAHAHDHTHGKKHAGQSQSRFAAHEHYHLHLGDIDADGKANGHTHAPAHARLPWERVEVR